MLRDNRGRFVKKALGGTNLGSPPVKQIRLKNGMLGELGEGYQEAFQSYNQINGPITLEDWALTVDGSRYLKTNNLSTIQSKFFVTDNPTTTSYDIVSGQRIELDQDPVQDTTAQAQPQAPAQPQPQESPQADVEAEAKVQQEPALENPIEGEQTPEGSTDVSGEKIKYYLKDGKRYDMNGHLIVDAVFDPDKYQIVFPPKSAGMNIFGNKPKGSSRNYTINRDRLSDFIDFTRAGLGAYVNNKIAQRAIDSEKPFLQDASESYRSVYGDYGAIVQGEKAAAQLRNLASRPLTSDGALQQDMQMKAQLQGQQYVDAGLSEDTEMQRQTGEVAWQQNKENQGLRHAAAMSNRQSMFMTEKNKDQIANMRDSANYSQVIAPWLTGIETRLRTAAAERKSYQDYFNQKAIHDKVWTTFTEGLTAEEIKLRDLYNTGGWASVSDYIGEDTAKSYVWSSLSQKLKQEETRQLAMLKGVSVPVLDKDDSENEYGLFAGYTGTGVFKNGGEVIYKARLTKRSKDNDRAARSIESSKKIAAQFVKKAMDSLYTYKDIELIAKPAKKKRKYQAGGGLPFVNYSPVFATSETGATTTSDTSTKKSSGDDEDEGLITKEIQKLMDALDPLPADMMELAGKLQKFEILKNMSDSGEVPAAAITSEYFKLLSQIKIAKFNREEYTKALDQLKGNGGLNELAVTSDGNLIGSDGKGNYEYFTPEQVNAGAHTKKGYALVTNSNLLYLRANDPEGAFRHDLINVAQGGVGMEVITKMINDAIQNLGTTTKEESGFVQIGNGKEIKAGLEFLQKAVQAVGDPSAVQTMSVADYYQAGYLTESQAESAMLAIDYLMNTLPANAQALLQVKGGSPEGAKQLLQSIVYSKTSVKTQFKATPKKMTNTGSGSGSGSGSGVDELKLTPVQMMQLGYTDQVMVTLQKGTKYAVQVNAQVLPINDVNKEGLGVTTLDKVASSTFGGALDMNNVTMGGQLIDPHAMQNVQIDATNLYVMNLPIDKSSPDGTIKPDLAWLQKIEAIDKTIRDKNITDIAQINQLYVEAGLPVLMDDSGNLNTRDYCKFGVLNGKALNAAFKDRDALDDTVVEMEDEDQIKNVLSIINKGRSEKDRVDFDSKSWLDWDWAFWSDYDSVYEGTVYIPVRTNQFTGMMSGGQYPTVETAAEVEALIQQQRRIQAGGGYHDPGLLTE